MSEQNDVHVGNQLFVSSALPVINESPVLPGRDPTCLGIGHLQFLVQFMPLDVGL